MTINAVRSDPDHVPCVITNKQTIMSVDTFHVVAEEETAQTLKARDYKDPQVIIMSKKDNAVSVGNGQTNNISMKPVANTLDTLDDVQKIMLKEEENMETIVRRLTPKECERLQGFPDDWTDIGEWTDTEGKPHKESSDTARYKALGNSIATPFWFWLMKRISATYERPATLGSLFDGIGGFPYCWERCNGKGTAIWASEIEEFPIAVTKRHFPERSKE